jgi:hypothetical protein
MRYQVIDCEFNRKFYGRIIGMVFDEAPSFARTRLVP